MIIIDLHRTREGYIKGFFVEGHAGMAERGQDIVCAAVSVLTQTTVLGLQRHLGLDLQVSRQNGYLTCMLPEPGVIATSAVQAVLETMAIGLMEIVEQFPEYVRIKEYRR